MLILHLAGFFILILPPFAMPLEGSISHGTCTSTDVLTTLEAYSRRGLIQYEEVFLVIFPFAAKIDQVPINISCIPVLPTNTHPDADSHSILRTQSFRMTFLDGMENMRLQLYDTSIPS